MIIQNNLRNGIELTELPDGTLFIEVSDYTIGLKDPNQHASINLTGEKVAELQRWLIHHFGTVKV